MIQVAGETTAALRKDSVSVKPRILWIHGGDSIDVSDRLVSFPGTSMNLGAFLSGATSARTPLTLLNADGFLTVGKASGLFSNRLPEDRQLPKITVEVGVRRADGTYEYIPLMAGYANGPVYQPGSVDFDIESPFLVLRDSDVPEDTVINPSSDTPAALAKSLITDNTVLTSADFTASWDVLDSFYQEIDWVIGGRIRKGTSLAAAVESLARSGLATIVPHEDGSLRLLSEFPEFGTVANDRYGDLIDETIAGDWLVSESRNISATSVEVAYNGVSVRYPSQADATEALVGKLHRQVGCPYIYLGRCAWTAAVVLWTQHFGFPMTKAWSMGIRGVVIQLGDRVRVHDPITDAEHLVRIVSKAWGQGRVYFTGVVDGHEASIVRRTYARWDSTTWGSGTEYLL